MGYRSRGWCRLAGASALALLLSALVIVEHPITLRAAATVTIQNLAFAPATLTVTAGTTVMWTNQDTVSHTTTSDTGGVWNSGIMGKGGSFSFTFAKAGTFAYHCDIHPAMHGTITVTPVAIPTATPRPTSTTAPPTSTPRPTATAVPAKAIASATPTTAAPAMAASPSASAAAVPASASSAARNPSPPGPGSPLISADFLAPIASFPDSGDHRYFAATGHSLNFGFKAYWERNGGIQQFGYPISEEFPEAGADGLIRTVQYFERARFEYHLDLLATTPDGVELGMLGREMAIGHEQHPAFVPVGADAAMGDRQFFAATGHTLGGQFADYWQANGDLAHFGYPISEEFPEIGADGVSRTVQYFERYRFEYRADTQRVELSLLGVQDAQSRGYLG